MLRYSFVIAFYLIVFLYYFFLIACKICFLISLLFYSLIAFYFLISIIFIFHFLIFFLILFLHCIVFVFVHRVSMHYLRHSTLIHVFGCGSILPDWTKKGNWADVRQSVTHPSEAFGTLACLDLPKLWVFKSESKVISLAEYSKRLCLSIPVITSAGVYHNVCESCFNTESMLLPFSLCFSPFIVLPCLSGSFERSAKAQHS